MSPSKPNRPSKPNKESGTAPHDPLEGQSDRPQKPTFRRAEPEPQLKAGSGSEAVAATPADATAASADAAPFGRAEPKPALKPESESEAASEPRAAPALPREPAVEALQPTPSSPPHSRHPPRRKRAEKSLARREAIVAAALDEFTERGFAATRMEDVARRAGVGKGTIYLHFTDKEALFQQLVTTMLGPVVLQLRQLPEHDEPARAVVERLFALFADEIYGTRRREVVRLVMTEGPRFPQLAEFYYRHVVEPASSALRSVLDRARARGELSGEQFAKFPLLVIAPGLVAVIWSSLFERFAPLDMVALMRAHLDILFGPGDAQ